MSFGSAVREFRVRLGKSLRSTAKDAGIDPAYLSRIETDQVSPSEHVLDRLCSPLGLTHTEIFLLAGRLPEELRHFVERDSRRASEALRRMTEMVVAEPTRSYGLATLALPGRSLIEDGFPISDVSLVAQAESWRKEIYRPIYHLHKWWAKRLGTVFRAAILGAQVPEGSSLMKLFYQPVRLPAPVVYDPFMGSGTTIGEAVKLGCRVIGRDINPIAHRMVKVAMGSISREKVTRYFRLLSDQAAKELRDLYRFETEAGEVADVLYYFWVMQMACPCCSKKLDLFSSRVFAKHAYPKRHPTVHACCPGCDAVVVGSYLDESLSCSNCDLTFDPKQGIVRRSWATCDECDHRFRLIDQTKKLDGAPRYRMYAKLVLLPDGRKEYQAICDKDRHMYRMASQRLDDSDIQIPEVELRKGHNTSQALNYGFRRWRDMFNHRQLLAIGVLAKAIGQLPRSAERDALYLLLSSCLEFNNMFASYKGEGTGAVRHMFSHHVLKPERTPIEANLWGTPKSSGSFSTLFESRLLRAVDYKNAPFELRLSQTGSGRQTEKVFGISPPMERFVVEQHPDGELLPGEAYISCGDSADTDIPTATVDLVVTDPPFFDNVHYSELADFFHVWQQIWFAGGGTEGKGTTRRGAEVQDGDQDAFARKLTSVFIDCHRVLRDSGVMVFSYHHSRYEGWLAVARAVVEAGFTFTSAQPVKAEMAGATPKSQANSPIQLDVLLVCRKRGSLRSPHEARDTTEWAIARAVRQCASLEAVGLNLSDNDLKVVLASAFLVALSDGVSDSQELLSALEIHLAEGSLQLGVESVRELLASRPQPTSESRAASQLELSY